MALDSLESDESKVSAASLTASTFRLGKDSPLDALGLFDFSGIGGFGAQGALEVPTERKWGMLCDPQVYAALWLRRSSVMFDGVQVMAARKFGEPGYEKAKRWADVVMAAFAGIDRGLFACLMELQEADWWTNQVADGIWAEKGFDGKQWLFPDVLDIHAPGDYILHRKDGKIIGVQPLTGGVGAVLTDGKAKVFAEEKFLIYPYRPNARQWAGTDLARVVWIPYWMKNGGHPQNMKYMEMFSNPSLVGTAPEDAPKEVELLDEHGVRVINPVTGRAMTVPPQKAMANGLQNFSGSGGFTVIPPKSKLALMEAQGDGRIFVGFEDSRDWQIMTGILGTGNMTGRAKYGSNASAQTGESVVDTPVAADSQVLATILTKLARTVVKVNARSEGDLQYAPTIMLGDPQSGFLQKIFGVMLANSVIPDAAMVAELAARLNVPTPNLEKLQARMEAAPAPMTVPGTGGNA